MTLLPHFLHSSGKIWLLKSKQKVFSLSVGTRYFLKYSLRTIHNISTDLKTEIFEEWKVQTDQLPCVYVHYNNFEDNYYLFNEHMYCKNGGKPCKKISICLL